MQAVLHSGIVIPGAPQGSAACFASLSRQVLASEASKVVHLASALAQIESVMAPLHSVRLLPNRVVNID